MTNPIFLNEVADPRKEIINEYVEPKYKKAEPCFQECMDGMNCEYPKCKGYLNEVI